MGGAFLLLNPTKVTCYTKPAGSTSGLIANNKL